MGPVGVHSLGPAAAQGGQDTSSEHASGSLFTGWGTDIQTPQYASHHQRWPTLANALSYTNPHRTTAVHQISNEASATSVHAPRLR